MTFNDQRVALLNLILNEATFKPTQYPNTAILDVNYNPVTPNNQMWRRVTIMRAPPTPYTAGMNGTDEQNGVMDVDIFVPKGSGDVAAHAHADELAAILKWRKLDQNGLCLHTRTVNVSPMPADETWYGVKVSVQFRVFTKRS